MGIVRGRSFLIATVLAAGAVATAAGMAGGKAPDPVPTTFPTQQGQPFAEPRVLSSSNGVLATTLTVSRATYQVGGTPIRGKSYDGTFVGPTLRVSPGDRIVIRFENQLNQVTNIHFHGFHVSPSGISDNVLRMIPPHRTVPVVVQVPADMAPGTYWYHSHAHHLSEEQVMDGLSGVIVVEGEQRFLPPALRGVTEHVFALKDLQARRGAAVSKDIDSNAPTTRTVNGQVDPQLTMRPGETQLWRFANISADIWYRLHADGLRFHVVRQDANPTTRVAAANQLLLPPGKRYDVLVQAPRAGTYRLRTLRFSTGPAGDHYPARTLATVVAAGAALPPAALPARQQLPRHLAPHLAPAHIDRRRRIVFSESANGNRFFINGRQFDPNRVDERVRLGDTEQWTIVNTSRELHPFHIHVDDFQLMAVNGRRVHAPSLQDTVPLPVGGRVRIRMRFANFTGKFVFHCHILNHEDHGMMALVDVVRGR
jgi:suppressor of ftsI